MKKSFIIILFVLFKISFLFSQNVNKPDSLLTNEEFIEKLLPQIINFDKQDSSMEFFPKTIDSVEVNKRYPYLRIGKFIDSIQTFAINCDMNDSIIKFYKLVANHWKRIGYEKDSCIKYISIISFQDLDWKKGNEIKTSTFFNMNGNSWYRIYKYDFVKDSIKFAGDFCCQDSIDDKRKRIYEYHEGSWYMDLYKTIYIWNNDTLVPLKHVRLVLNQNILKHFFPYKIEYFENPDMHYLSQYKLIFKQNYSEKKYKKYWDDFYEN